MKENDKPYIKPETKLPETTIKAFFLGAILSAALAAANAYLGLFAGLTVSASIPAAVISMAILKLFKKNNILENNIVQTAASAGESLAAGVIFYLSCPGADGLLVWFQLPGNSINRAGGRGTGCPIYHSAQIGTDCEAKVEVSRRCGHFRSIEKW